MPCRSHYRILFSNCANSRFKLASTKKLSTFSGDVVDLSYTSYDNVKAGSSTPIMVLHGLLDSRNSWAGISEVIHGNTERKVYNIDSRNHGSSPHSPNHTYIHMAHDIKKLINTLGHPKVSIIGHSMSGRTSMVFSLLFPELVSCLIVVDISPASISENFTKNFPKILDFAAKINISQFRSVDKAKAYAKQELIKFGLNNTSLTLTIILRNIGMTPDRSVGWICNMDILNKYFPTLTRFPYIIGRSYSGPVLFIAARQSGFIPAKDVDSIKRLFPRAEIEYVSGVGHNMHEENDTMLLELAVDFFARNKMNIRKICRS